MRNHHLSYAHTAVNHEGNRAKIYKYDLYFSAIVGIYCSRSVEDCDPVSRRKSGARPDLALCARRQCEGDSGRNHGAAAGRNL